MAKVKGQKKTKRVGTIFFNGLLLLLIVITAIFVVDRLNNRVTYIFGHSVIFIATGSMEPAIPAESCIIIKKVKPADIEIGDIITFYSEDPAISGKLNTHRVASIIESANGIEFETKGDGNVISDGYTVKAKKLIGKHVTSLPLFSFIIAAIISPYGYFILFLLFALYLAAMFIPSAKRRKTAAREAEFERRVAEEVARLHRESDDMSESTENQDKND